MMAGSIVLAAANEEPVQIHAGGRSFDSFAAYAASKDIIIEDHGRKDDAWGITSDVAGVRPSLSGILREFQKSSLAQQLVSSRETLAKALEHVAEGKDGPLLLMAQGKKVRIMQLKPDVGPGTKP